MKVAAAGGRQQALSHERLPHDPRDPAECLDVETRFALGADQEKQQAHGQTIQGPVLDGRRQNPGSDQEILDPSGASMGNPHAMPDTGRQHGLPLLDGLHQLLSQDMIAVGGSLHKRAQGGLLVGGVERDPDSLGCQELGKQHGLSSLSDCIR